MQREKSSHDRFLPRVGSMARLPRLAAILRAAAVSRRAAKGDHSCAGWSA
jgi:hypothetical protein